MDEKINHSFNEKMTQLQDLSRKNTKKMNDIKQELKMTIKKLKTDCHKLSIDELRDELKDLKFRKNEITEEITEIKSDIQTLSILSHNFKPEYNVKDIFASADTLDQEIFKKYFIEIVSVSKNIQKQLKEYED